MATGVQKTVYEALEDLTRKVGEGAFGEGDDFDAAAFRDDMVEIEDLAE